MSPNDLRKKETSAEVVSMSMFAKELDKIWTEIKSLHNKFAKNDQPNESDVNNNQVINTLRQEKS